MYDGFWSSQNETPQRGFESKSRPRFPADWEYKPHTSNGVIAIKTPHHTEKPHQNTMFSSHLPPFSRENHPMFTAWKSWNYHHLHYIWTVELTDKCSSHVPSRYIAELVLTRIVMFLAGETQKNWGTPKIGWLIKENPYINGWFMGVLLWLRKPAYLCDTISWCGCPRKIAWENLGKQRIHNLRC